MTLSFGSLFSGIGGIDLGFERAGMQCLWQSEIDPYCNQILAAHWPDVSNFGDIREIGKHNLPDIDLLCGGFPCQPYSVAGKRKGKADERNMWPEVYRLIYELKPKWFVGENVPGLLTFTYFKKICNDLESAGYEVISLEFPAAAIGAPHLRYRVFIVAYSDKSGLEGRISKSLQKCSGQRVTWASNTPMADTDSNNQLRRCSNVQMGRSRKQSQVKKANNTGTTQWVIEPNVGRVANGIPARVDRLRALGNAVVPQVSEWIGRIIVNAQ